MAGPADGTVITYDPENAWLLLNLGDRTLQIQPVEDVRIQRGDEDTPEAYVLWMDAERADVLGKMIGYILEKVKISERSQATLRGLLPEVRRIAAALGSSGDDE